ncbi:MAG: LysE family translocator [Proteobacteria bacterium]|nr:LysE family translocator [Pseudomonadota bacterium]
MLFAEGLALGFSIAAPVGPIGVLCIRRTLHSGFATGAASGLGAAFADTLYAAIAAFGLTAVSQFLSAEQGPIRLFGGIFLLWLAYKTYTSKTKAEDAHVSQQNLTMSCVSTFLLTLTNPATIIAFVAVFAGLGMVDGSSFAATAEVVGGVFAGSMLWWLILTGFMHKMKKRFSLSSMKWVNRISGVVLFLFALWALLSVFIY